MAKMELNRQEEYLNRIDRLKLMDDDFFSEALDGKVEAVEFILQVVLEKIVDLCRIMTTRRNMSLTILAHPRQCMPAMSAVPTNCQSAIFYPCANCIMFPPTIYLD